MWSLVISVPDLAHKILLEVFIQLVFKRERVYWNQWSILLWMAFFFPSFTLVLHHHDSTDASGVILIYARIKEGRIMPLLFLSVCLQYLWKSWYLKVTTEKNREGFLCFFISLFSLLSLSLSPLLPHPFSKQKQEQKQTEKKQRKKWPTCLAICIFSIFNPIQKRDRPSPRGWKNFIVHIVS